MVVIIPQIRFNFGFIYERHTSRKNFGLINLVRNFTEVKMNATKAIPEKLVVVVHYL